jgi:hypothetical protein
MTQEAEVSNELNRIMLDVLLQLQKLVSSDSPQKQDPMSIVKIFLLGIISTAADLVEMNLPGSAPFIYADVEAAAKLGGLRAIKNMQSVNGLMNYSVSNIDENDETTAMNYLGQELGAALFKGMHELPMPLRKPEMLLRGVEALLTNLLNQKFDNSHQILDSLCAHIHMALDDLQSRRH